jgi:uncharacterized membrane protein YidH (DUF202 family)
MGLFFLLFGIAFGFALSRAQATDYDTIISMFRLTDLHLVWVMVVAIAVAAVGLAILRRRRAQALIGCSIDIHPKAMQRGILPAGLIFGVGWALSGG